MISFYVADMEKAVILMKNRSRKRLARIAAALLVLNIAGCGVLKDNSKEVIIRVNGRSITAGEYGDALKSLVPTARGHEADELVELKKELVTEMVEEELLLEEAQAAGITVSPEELSSEVDMIRQEYGESPFRAVIEERYGSMEGWEDKIRRKLLVRKAIERITASVQVTEKAMREYYRDNRDEFTRPEQVRARMIVVSTEEQASAIREKLTPEGFAAVAKEVSLSPEGKDGGDLGYFGRGDMPGEFEEAVFGLKPGEISPVAKTDYGYHIFLLEDRRKGGTVSYAEVRPRIMEKIRGEKAATALDAWMAEKKRTSSIEIKEELL